jgi:hypothetical protein
VIAAVGDSRAARLLSNGKLDGLSFGYRVHEAKSAGGLRELVEPDLVEVSLVAHPMQPRARCMRSRWSLNGRRVDVGT